VRLVLEWDGTVTERDTLELVIESFGDMATYRRTGEAIGTALSHDEALARSFATVRAPLADVVARVVTDVRLRAEFNERRGVAYEPFGDVHDVLAVLDGELVDR